MNVLQLLTRDFAKAARGAALALALVVIAGSGLRAQTMPPNLDFSYGNFTNWLCYTGIVDTGTKATGATYKNAVLSGPIAGPPSRHAITSGTGLDSFWAMPVVAPGGGLFSMKLGNRVSTGPVADAEFIRYNLHVPSGTTKYSLLYQFAVNLDNSGHQTSAQPTFHVVAIDSASGKVIPSANNIYVNQNLPSVVPFYTGPVSATAHGWAPSTLNLSGYGGKTVTIEVMTSDCYYSGHGGYAYFDVISAVDYLAPVISNCDLQAQTVKLQGPPGYQYYQWYDQNFSTALNSSSDTSRSLTLPLPSTPQYYNLVLIPRSPTSIPDTIRTNVFSSFTINATASPSAVTPGGTVHLYAAVTGGAGNFNYQWSGDTTLSSSTIFNPTANPLTGTQYVVTVSDTNGCFQRDTVQVSVSPLSAGPGLANSNGTSFTVANVITPGSSLNGQYRIVRIEPGCTLRTFRIYNSWGQKVFETANAADGWDGSFNGAPQPAGVYVYVLEGIRNGKAVTQQGSLTLIR